MLMIKTVYYKILLENLQAEDCLFILCRQESSLLWTPALRSLYRSNVPVQGEEGNCQVCAVYVRNV